MSTRSRFIVTYDIADAKRLRRIYKKMRGFGDPLQLSVFSCVLSPIERELMTAELHKILNHKSDQVLIIELGPASKRARRRIQVLGRSTPPPVEDVVVF